MSIAKGFRSRALRRDLDYELYALEVVAAGGDDTFDRIGLPTG